MKEFVIAYHMMPEAKNIIVRIFAEDYEKACIYAKNYRQDCFSIYSADQYDRYLGTKTAAKRDL